MSRSHKAMRDAGLALLENAAKRLRLMEAELATVQDEKTRVEKRYHEIDQAHSEVTGAACADRCNTLSLDTRASECQPHLSCDPLPCSPPAPHPTRFHRTTNFHLKPNSATRTRA